MKYLIAFTLIFSSISSFAAEGTVKTNTPSDFPGLLFVEIHGDAAKEMSKSFSEAGLEFHRDRFSGSLVQTSKNLKCIETRQPGNTEPDPIYCAFLVEKGEVK